MNELIWALLLLLLGLGLLVLEAFVPSGGVLGFLSVLSIVAAIVVAFLGGWQTGLLMLVTTMVIVPVVIALGVKWWPHTPIGRLVVLEPPASEEVLPEHEAYRRLQALIGRLGTAKTKMLPSGAVVIDGRTYDAVSEGMAIDAGQPIRVTAIRTNRIVVRLEELPGGGKPAGADLLAQPAETLGLGPLDDGHA